MPKVYEADRPCELAPEAKGFDLRLYDARGTAATRLLDAGLGLNDIASYMGWSIRYASQVIEHYAVISEDETDRVNRALEAAQKAKTEQNCKPTCKRLHLRGGFYDASA